MYATLNVSDISLRLKDLMSCHVLVHILLVQIVFSNFNITISLSVFIVSANTIEHYTFNCHLRNVLGCFWPSSGTLYRVIKKDGLNFVSLYFLNYIWYVNDLHNI
jgi:hypothetical protein